MAGLAGWCWPCVGVAGWLAGVAGLEGSMSLALAYPSVWLGLVRAVREAVRPWELARCVCNYQTYIQTDRMLAVPQHLGASSYAAFVVRSCLQRSAVCVAGRVSLAWLGRVCEIATPYKQQKAGLP